MSTATLEHSSEVEAHSYRSVSKAAVACVVFAILGLLTYLSPVFLILPVIGMIFGFYALSAFRRYPGELVGHGVAKIGFWACLLTTTGGIGMHAFIYATEVPEGYQRISFADLAPIRREGVPYAKKALELDDKKVFVKGYVRPGDKKRDLEKFILVGDFGSCCFGGNPKISDIIAITIVNDQKVDYSFRKRRIGGKFKLHSNQRRVNEKDIPSVFYEIEADYIK